MSEKFQGIRQETGEVGRTDTDLSKWLLSIANSKLFNGNQAEMARAIGMDKNYLNGMIVGRVKVSPRTVTRVLNRLEDRGVVFPRADEPVHVSRKVDSIARGSLRELWEKVEEIEKEIKALKAETAELRRNQR